MILEDNLKCQAQYNFIGKLLNREPAKYTSKCFSSIFKCLEKHLLGEQNFQATEILYRLQWMLTHTFRDKTDLIDNVALELILPQKVPLAFDMSQYSNKDCSIINKVRKHKTSGIVS